MLSARFRLSPQTVSSPENSYTMSKLTSLLPRPVHDFLGETRQRVELALRKRISCDTSRLTRNLDEAKLRAILTSDEGAAAWDQIAGELGSLFGNGSRSGGVNPGDRRAIFHLIRALAPRSVLEIGTHVGASTVHIAAALRQRVASAEFHLTTVDILDVNNAVNGPWLKVGLASSPAGMIEKIGVAEWTRFVTQPSLEYLVNSREQYDFIFLDGDHAAKTVYREIPAALQRLNPGGVILLHDYFPELQPLWSNGVVLPGPWLAAERLRSEGAAFRVLPLGELPWGTKLGSKTTGLALAIGQ